VLRSHGGGCLPVSLSIYLLLGRPTMTAGWGGERGRPLCPEHAGRETDEVADSDGAGRGDGGGRSARGQFGEHLLRKRPLRHAARSSARPNRRAARGLGNGAVEQVSRRQDRQDTCST